MHFSALVSPGGSGCVHLPWGLVNHKGWAKSEKGESAMDCAQTRKSVHRLKGSGMLPCGSNSKDVLEVTSSAVRIIRLLKPPSVPALQPCSPPSREGEPKDAPPAACCKRSGMVLAAGAWPADHRESDPQSPWASDHDHHESLLVGAASL